MLGLDAFTRAELFALTGIAVSLIRYVTYFWAIYKKEARPHVMTWFNWSLVVGIGAYTQQNIGGGPSVWVLWVVSSTCLFISLLALFIGEKNITRSDWVAFLLALAAIPLWLATDNPYYTFALLVVIDALTYYPTIRKSWRDPWGEPPLSYFWSGLRYFFALFAVEPLALKTMLYPFLLMAGDWGFALYVYWRRRVLSRVN